jgi:methylated-DNA-protein-cysteine methyltransferase-like protein
MDERHARILTAVRRIPRGKVATYGQVARLAGLPRRARLVGAVLRELPEGTGVPWQRVVNAQGRVSPRGAPGAVDDQRSRLEREGVAFLRGGRIAMREHQWGRAEPAPAPEDGPPAPRGGKNRVSPAARGR